MRRIMVIIVVVLAGLASLVASPAFANGSYTTSSTAVRHCTYLPDPSCQQIKWYIPAGTPVTMRCWTDESWYNGTNRWFWIDGNGVQGFVSANNIWPQTTVGWCNGMPEMQAVRWAGSHLGELYDVVGNVGYCLQFVHDAWVNWGSGIDIGYAADAITYWNNHPAQQVRGAVYAPVGALVFWGVTPTSPVGHVAISIGDAYAISTYERNTYEVHVLNMNERTSHGYPYLGYIMPTW